MTASYLKVEVAGLVLEQSGERCIRIMESGAPHKRSAPIVPISAEFSAQR
jgi:hypothetical protein